MAIAFDATSNTSTITNADITLAHTCTGSDLLLVVAVAVGLGGGDVTAYTTEVSYNGVPMTCALTGLTTNVPLTLPTGSTSSGAVLFYLLAPAAGNNNIFMTTDEHTGAAVNANTIVAASYSGVVSVSGGTFTRTGATQTNSPTLGITSVTGDLVVGLGSHGDVISGAGGTTTRQGFNNSITGTAGGCVSLGDSPGATPNIDFTSAANDHWVMIGLDMSAAPPPALTLPMVRSSLRLR